jgi:beta-phosphoglucomutase-like phosphatase (HAD superfamily)
MPWNLAILDCDGVLVDTEAIANRLFSVMLGEIGLQISHKETLHLFMGRSMSAVTSLVEERLGRSLPPTFASEFFARMCAAFRDELRPMPGVIAALDRIAVPT